MDKPVVTETSGVGLDTSSRSLVNNVISGRDVRYYTVARFELRSISNMNGSATFYVGLVTMCFGLEIGIAFSVLFADPKMLSPGALSLAYNGVLFATVFTVAFSVFAFFNLRRAKEGIDDIMQESRLPKEENE